MPKVSGSSEPATKSPSSKVSPYEFRKRPVIVQAWQNLRGNPIAEPEWLNEAKLLNVIRPYPGAEDGSLQLCLNDGRRRIAHGDWIVRDVLGGLDIVRPALFSENYEEVVHSDGE